MMVTNSNVKLVKKHYNKDSPLQMVRENVPGLNPFSSMPRFQVDQNIPEGTLTHALPLHVSTKRVVS